MTALAASIATIESVCAIAEAQNATRKSARHDMRVSEEEFAEMQAKRSRWTRGGNINTESMNSEPGNPERDKRAMYRPSHGATHSATANSDHSTSGSVVNTESMIGCALTRSPRQDANLSFDVPILQPSRRAVAPIPLERDVLSACLKALELHPRVSWVARMNCGGMKNDAGQYVKFGFKGMADITGQLVDGRRLEVETKRPGESLTLDQQAFLQRVIVAGGVAFVARDVRDVMKALA